MNELDAVSRMVAKYPGGRPAIAARMGITEDVLRKRLAGQQGHKLGLTEARQIAEWCADVKSEGHEALATIFAVGGGKLIDLPVIDMGGRCSMSVAAASVRRTAEAMATIAEAKADGKWSDNEIREAERAMGMAIAKIQVLRALVRAEHANDNMHWESA